MTLTTPVYALPYPESTDAPNGPSQIGALALAVEALLQAFGAGTAYTPVLTASVTNPTLGTGSSSVGRYSVIGKRVFFSAEIILGTGATAGSGFYTFSLPVAARTGTPWQIVPVEGLDSSTGRYVAGIGEIASAGNSLTRIRFGDSGTTATSTSFGNATPWVWADADMIRVSGSYESA